jgi:hypothetical protein
MMTKHRGWDIQVWQPEYRDSVGYAFWYGCAYAPDGRQFLPIRYHSFDQALASQFSRIDRYLSGQGHPPLPPIRGAIS